MRGRIIDAILCVCIHTYTHTYVYIHTVEPSLIWTSMRSLTVSGKLSHSCDCSICDGIYIHVNVSVCGSIHLLQVCGHAVAAHGVL